MTGVHGGNALHETGGGTGGNPGGDTDDEPVGRVWSRREMLAFFGTASGGLLLAACLPAAQPAGQGPSQSAEPAATEPAASAPAAAAPASATPASAALEAPPTCIVTPAMTEGPYFVDDKLNRSDIRADTATGALRDGALLTLVMYVSRVNGSQCLPLPNAMVDIWHCDAAGVYSAVRDRSFSTVDEDFLRGYQLADANGRVQFTTIYPGWYPGRAVHIHFKIRTDAGAAGGYEFTSQLFFDDALTDQVHAAPPYAQKGPRDRRNADDGIFRSGGDLLIVAATPTGQGVAGRFDIGLAF